MELLSRRYFYFQLSSVYDATQARESERQSETRHLDPYVFLYTDIYYHTYTQLSNPYPGLRLQTYNFCPLINLRYSALTLVYKPSL